MIVFADQPFPRAAELLAIPHVSLPLTNKPRCIIVIVTMTITFDEEFSGAYQPGCPQRRPSHARG
jgi:hypothetical protein